MCTWAACGYPFLSLGASNRLDRVAAWEDTFRGQRIDSVGVRLRLGTWEERVVPGVWLGCGSFSREWVSICFFGYLILQLCYSCTGDVV